MNLDNPLWPRLDTTIKARRAVRVGALCAAFVAVFLGASAVAAAIKHTSIMGISAGGVLPAMLFGTAAWRIWDRSLTWSIAALALFVVQQVRQFLILSRLILGPFVALALILGFIHGLRGVLAYRRVEQLSAE